MRHPTSLRVFGSETTHAPPQDRRPGRPGRGVTGRTRPYRPRRPGSRARRPRNGGTMPRRAAGRAASPRWSAGRRRVFRRQERSSRIRHGARLGPRCAGRPLDPNGVVHQSPGSPKAHPGYRTTTPHPLRIDPAGVAQHSTAQGATPSGSGRGGREGIGVRPESTRGAPAATPGFDLMAPTDWHIAA